MRFVAFLIIACVIISVARTLMPVLIFTFIISILWAMITRPLELLGFALILLMTESLSLRPLTTILCVAGVATLVVIRKPVRQSAPNSGTKKGRNSGKLDS